MQDTKFPYSCCILYIILGTKFIINFCIIYKKYIQIYIYIYILYIHIYIIYLYIIYIIYIHICIYVNMKTTCHHRTTIVLLQLMHFGIR